MSSPLLRHPSSERLLRAQAWRSHYSTAAFTQAQPNALMMKETRRAESVTAATPQCAKQEQQPEADPDEPPPKATIRERLRFLSRRYGWWALGVYLLASVVDFSLVFVSIHLLGADHIRDLEDRFRKYIGMGKREMEDHEVAAWPVVVGTDATDSIDHSNHFKNNAEAAHAAVQQVHGQVKPKSSSSSSSGSSTIWTEVVLAYTIHKTLLLPFRVGVTAAITPSFVKYMVKLGWAKDNAAVQKAAHKIKMARDAAKAAKATKGK